MSTETDAVISSPVKEQPETVENMETSNNDVEPVNTTDEAVTNDVEETSTETKSTKRKRSVKMPTETEETNISNGRPRRTLTKREETSATLVNGTSKKKNQRNSTEQTSGDADDEQERDKNIPILHDVADIVWVKMGGHPWWPSLIVRDPNDTTRCFTKVTGSARAKRMYFVAFYGSTADFAWVPDASIIPYQGVEAFTKYAQEMVDKAQTKSQKEQLTERFQLKVTIGRREDWESAVREADQAAKQTSETRLGDVEPKLEFYTSKLVPSKGQPGRKPKNSANKTDELSESTASMDVNERSLLAEKAFEFRSDDESSNDESSPRKTPSVKIKLRKQGSNDPDVTTPPAKRRYVRKTGTETTLNENTDANEETANGSSNETPVVNGNSTGQKKRGRPRLSKPTVIINNDDNIQKSDSSPNSPPGTTKAAAQKKPIVKPQAFMNKSNPVSSLNNILIGHHHRYDTRLGFLSPFEEQEIFDAVDQLRPTKTFDDAEQIARRRFEHILCLNLNKTHVDIPQEWFYSFLFAHPILIVKNSHWFNDNKYPDSLIDTDLVNDINRTQTSNSLHILKHQLGILSKLYRNELQVRQSVFQNNKKNSIDKEEHVHTN